MTQHDHVPPIHDLSHPQQVRATGSVLGAATADAVGAPYEFKDPDLYAGDYPRPMVGGAGEMTGGGGFGWAPGEFTDDTQMAVALANALEEADGFAPDVVWKHFRAWSQTAVDVGITISTALRNKTHVGAALAAHEQLGGRTASNGSVMRIAPVAVFGLRLTRMEAADLAVKQASITHHDESASVGAAFVADVIRGCIVSGDFAASLASSVEYFGVSPWAPVFAAHFAPLLTDEFDPRDEGLLPNGTVWTAVAQAVWAVRSTSSFHDAVVAAINLGGDTDTVAAIAGAMAGSVYGAQGIPVRWATYVHGKVQTPHAGEVVYRGQDLANLARRLMGLGDAPMSHPEPPIAARKVHPAGVYAANLDGAAAVPKDRAVVSLCLTGERFLDHPVRRQVYMRDNDGDANPNLFFAVKESVEAIQAFLAEGREVVVHCHGGRSRTGLVLKAWYMMHEGASHDEAEEWITEQWEHYRDWTPSFKKLLDKQWSHHVAATSGAGK